MGLSTPSYDGRMTKRMLIVLCAGLVVGCDGGESQPSADQESASLVDTTAEPVQQSSARDGVPPCPDRSDIPRSENPDDERSLFELSGPVRRVEEHVASYTLSKSNRYEQDPLEFRLALQFDVDGQLVSCRTNLGSGQIERNEFGQLMKICMPVGSGSVRQRVIKTFDGWGRLMEHWTVDASGNPLTRTLASHDQEGRVRNMRTDSYGIMTTLTIRTFAYDDMGRPDSIRIDNSAGELVNTTDYTYNLGSRSAAREQVNNSEGKPIESTKMTLDDAGNWTVRNRNKFRKDSQDNWHEEKFSTRRRTIEYFGDAPASDPDQSRGG